MLIPHEVKFTLVSKTIEENHAVMGGYYGTQADELTSTILYSVLVKLIILITVNHLQLIIIKCILCVVEHTIVYNHSWWSKKCSLMNWLALYYIVCLWSW